MRKEKMVNKLDQGIRLSLFALIFLLPFSNSAIEVCFGFAFALWVIKHLLLRSFKVEPSMLNKAIYIFILVGFLSVMGSLYHKESLYAFFSKFMEGVLLYFLMIEVVKEKKHVSVIIGLFLFIAVVVSIDGIIQYFFTGIDIFRQKSIIRGGATAAFGHPNKFGAYLLFPLFMVLGTLIDNLKEAKKINPKLFGLFCIFGLLFFIFIFTRSKGAWLGFITAILFFIFCINRRVFLITTVVIIIVLALVFLIVPDSFLRNFHLDSGMIEGSFIYRTRIWRDTVGMIKDRPVFGHGINTYMRVFQNYRSDIDDPCHYPTYAHNCYLQMATEMGLAGLIAFLWIIARFFRGSLDKRADYASLGIASGLFAFLVHSFFDTNLYSLQLNILFWFMLGFAVAKAKINHTFL